MKVLETIFRTGVSASNDVERLTAVGYFRRKHPAMAGRTDAAMAQLATLTSSLRQHAVGRAADTTLREIQACKTTISSYMQGAKLHGEEVLKTAPCVAATLASMVTNGALAERTFDVVYIDEASMVALPFALAAAARGRKQLIIGGTSSSCRRCATRTTRARPTGLRATSSTILTLAVPRTWPRCLRTSPYCVSSTA